MILVVGLSPAWQRTLVFERFVPGKVNRAIRVTATASGKGVNVARVASILGADVKLLTVTGGARGRWLLASLRRQGMPVHAVTVEGETRICQTLLSDGPTTELVEECAPLRPVELQEVLRVFRTEVPRAEMVVLTGTVPKGCGDDFYARLIVEARRHDVPVLIDAQKAQLLNALKKRPLLVKINRDELAAATQLNCTQRSGLSRALHRLLKDGPRHAVITDGAKSVFVSETPGRTITRLNPPRVKAQNPIGSGDAMMAGIAVGLLRGVSMTEAARFGIACGAANAMTAEPGFLRLADVKRLCSTAGPVVSIV
ncbi:MAG TPA: hexose kinase [Verrucomicrobiae bacterium]|nr:hexose kinase [Verrucomicrobiae bacterium]